MADDLKACFERHGFPLTADQLAQFRTYRTELVRWNAHINLTAITEPDAIVHKHFLDSLRVLEYICLKNNHAVIDIGTGAGFPGVVLKIYRPDIRLTLVDSAKKKTSFLKFLVSQLGLHENGAVEVLAARAEACAQQREHIGGYDWVFTRYVAALQDSAPYCLPLLKPTGRWVAYKGDAVAAQMEVDKSDACLGALNGAVEAVFRSRKFQRSYVVMCRTDTHMAGGGTRHRLHAQ